MPYVEKGDDNGNIGSDPDGPCNSCTSTGGNSAGGLDNQSSYTMSAALRSVTRIVLRLIASGALTALVNQFVGALSPTVAALVLSMWASALTYAQVAVEDKTGHKVLVGPSTSTAVVNKVNQDAQTGGE